MQLVYGIDKEISVGYIYLILNDINDKVYVGQTTQSVEKRFNEHVWVAKRNRVYSKLYTAMRNIGIEHFYAVSIVECEDAELNRYEQYFVELYNSLQNGYNTLYPYSCKRLRAVHEYDDKVIELYDAGKSFSSIAKELNISTSHINGIILERGTHREYHNLGGRAYEAKRVVMYDRYFRPERMFESIGKAYRWLLNNTDFRVTQYGAYAFIDVACQNGNIAYGHRWQLESDLKCSGKLFRTKFDKEEYLTGKDAYKPDGETYYVVDGSLNKVKTFHEKTKCIDCGKILSCNGTLRCKECSNRYKKISTGGDLVCRQCGRAVTWLSSSGTCMSCYNVSIKGKTPKPSKEELSKLLASGMKKSQIAAMYGRTASTIHYWINSYGLR